MRVTRIRFYALLAPLLVAASASASVYGAIHPRDTGAGVGVGGPTATSQTGAVAGGTVLPNGRLVTPAGATFNLGDFPLGVAVSPDGRLAVGINSGQGYGLNNSFGSFCTDRRQGTPCPYRDTLPSTVNLKQHAGDPATPTYDNSLSVVDLRTGLMREVKAVPTSYDATPGAKDQFNFFYTGLTFSPDGRHLYASGGGNDAIYDFPVQHDVVAPAPIRTVILTDTVKSQPALPVYGPANAFTKGMAVTPDGRLLLVAHEFQNTLDIVDTRTYKSTQAPLNSAPAVLGGAYPYTVVVSRDGRTAYVSEQGLNQVAVVRLLPNDPSGMPVGALETTIPTGDHPTGIALSPDNTQLYVANANDDTLSILALDPASGLPNVAVATVTLRLQAFAGQEQLGSAPNAVAVSPDGQRVYVALAGDDAVAVLGTGASFDGGATGTGAPGGSSPAATSFVVGGMIPTGWYPSGVAVSPDGSRIFVASAKGLGSRYLPLGSPLPANTVARRGSIDQIFQYDGNNMPGLLQVVPAPIGATLLSGLDTVRRDIQFAGQGDAGDRSPHNPIPAETITGTTPASLILPVSTPISYVVEVVRENRTFDQVLGDIGQHAGRGVTGDAGVDVKPDYTIFGRDVTPNAHALVGDITPTTGVADPAYATSDNFYSDGEASIQGHWWTAAANANDYLEKSWRDYYSPRNRVYDPVAAIADPKNCSIFTDALAKQTATFGSFSWRNYGELVGFNLGLLNVPQVSPVIPTSPLSSTSQSCGTTPLVPGPAGAPAPVNTNLTAVQNYINLDHDDRVVAREFINDVGLNPDGTTSISGTASPATFKLRNFSYLDIPADHTGGLQFTNTPRSRVAQNDAGLGMVVQALSHSKYWPNTAIFVMEDDSQDGLDHIDGHRNLLYVISPYAKHTGPDGKPGYVSHRHYSQVSVLKTIELLLGLPYLSTYDQNARPLYDLFQDKDSPAQLTGSIGDSNPADDLAGYAVQPYPSFIDETSAQYRAAAGQAADVPAAESRRLDLSGIDRAGPKLEVINWQLAHPTLSVPQQLVQEVRAWNARHDRAADGD
jgi:DNA-binding beta-propeller fold protein YncE